MVDAGGHSDVVLLVSCELRYHRKQARHRSRPKSVRRVSKGVPVDLCGSTYLEGVLVDGHKSLLIDDLLLSVTDLLADDDVLGLVELVCNSASVVGDGLLEGFVRQLHAGAGEEELFGCQQNIGSAYEEQLTLLPAKHFGTPSKAFTVFFCPFLDFLGAGVPSGPASAARLATPFLHLCQHCSDEDLGNTNVSLCS